MAGSPPKCDLEVEADEALEAAPSGPEKFQALKKAGLLRKAADAGGSHSQSVAGRGSEAASICHVFLSSPYRKSCRL
ncbi:MAG: hypothetical protein ACREEK_34605 [Bradyrhizobium sp.]